MEFAIEDVRVIRAHEQRKKRFEAKAAREQGDSKPVEGEYNGEGEGSMRHRPRAAKQQKTGSGVKRSDSELLEGQGVKPAGKQSRKVPRYSNFSMRHRPRAAKQQKTGSGVKRSDSERLEGQGVKPAGKQSRKVPQYSNFSMRHRPMAAKQQKTGSDVKRSDSERLEGQGVKPAGKQSRKVPQYSNFSIVYAHQYLL